MPLDGLYKNSDNNKSIQSVTLHTTHHLSNKDIINFLNISSKNLAQIYFFAVKKFDLINYSIVFIYLKYFKNIFKGV